MAEMSELEKTIKGIARHRAEKKMIEFKEYVSAHVFGSKLNHHDENNIERELYNMSSNEVGRFLNINKALDDLTNEYIKKETKKLLSRVDALDPIFKNA